MRTLAWNRFAVKLFIGAQSVLRRVFCSEVCFIDKGFQIFILTVKLQIEGLTFGNVQEISPRLEGLDLRVNWQVRNFLVCQSNEKNKINLQKKIISLIIYKQLWEAFLWLVIFVHPHFEVKVGYCEPWSTFDRIKMSSSLASRAFIGLCLWALSFDLKGRSRLLIKNTGTTALWDRRFAFGTDA